MSSVKGLAATPLLALPAFALRRAALLAVGLSLLLWNHPASADVTGKSKRSKSSSKSSASSEKDAKGREGASNFVEHTKAKIRKKSAERKADQATKRGDTAKADYYKAKADAHGRQAEATHDKAQKNLDMKFNPSKDAAHVVKEGVKSGNLPAHKAPGAYLKARSAMKDHNAKRDQFNKEMGASKQAEAAPAGPTGTE
jgi:hypothetical protein